MANVATRADAGEHQGFARSGPGGSEAYVPDGGGSGSKGKASWKLAAGDELVPGRTILKRLGGGKRYEVYLVWDDRLFAIVVAKVLRPDRSEDRRSIRALRVEAAMLNRLSHPVIVRQFDAALDGPRPHLVLEHLEGTTLATLLKKEKTLAPEQILPLALHIAAAIHYLANESIVHLDIKPDNLVMGAPPRLIDLSIARTIDQAASLTEPVGTTQYMAPEQCDPGNRGAIGPPADVWGLGAVLFRGIAGRMPFPAAKGADENVLEEKYPQLVRDREPLPSGISPVLAELVDACLAKDPAARPTAADLAFGLQPLVDALPMRMRLGRRGIRMTR